AAWPPSSGPRWRPPGRSPTRAGRHGPGRSGSPAAASPPGCTCRWGPAGSSTTWSASGPPGRSWRSTPIPTPRCSATPTSASSGTGTTSYRCCSPPYESGRRPDRRFRVAQGGMNRTVHRRVVRRVGGIAAAAAVAGQYVPSTVALGQWTGLRALPGGLCRWRGDGGSSSGGDRVALTFDDGPSPAGTPAVLDRLDRLGLVGTFFVLGSLVERDPDLVAEIRRRGHQVETHGHHHRHHLARTPWWVHRDLAAAAEAMAAVGVHPRWYRPTYGQATAATLLAARRQGWLPVLWSAWGREWATTDPAAV